ncbi:MAG TPA: acyl-CoA dehydrogenase, partial [Pseudomonadales bacterium]|nr:acyl-CoA dehydrogenase [Pseudomonadales bacterium]
EEIGRSLAPVPFVSSVLQASTALKRIPHCDFAQDLLAQLASGDKTASLAFFERGQREVLEHPKARVVNGCITGIKSMVADAASADFFIVSAASDEDEGGFGWYCAESAAAGLSIRPVECIDRIRPHADLHFQNVKCKRLGEAGKGQIYSQAAINAIAVLSAFEQLGAAEAALELSLNYVKTRLAFNRVVASYQAVKHKLADMYVKNQLARSHCYYGAWALTQSAEALPRAAAGARLAASDALNFAAEESVELHGGIGFTWEGDIQLYYRRARLLATQWGGRDQWARQLTEALRKERAI